jgi:hypothetical protein
MKGKDKDEKILPSDHGMSSFAAGGLRLYQSRKAGFGAAAPD